MESPPAPSVTQCVFKGLYLPLDKVSVSKTEGWTSFKKYWLIATVTFSHCGHTLPINIRCGINIFLPSLVTFALNITAFTVHAPILGSCRVGGGIVCQMLFPQGRYLDRASRSTQSALAYLRLTVLLAEAGSISGPLLNGCEAEKLAVKVLKDRKYTQPFLPGVM